MSQPANQRARRDAIEPFWLRLRQISLYPAQGSAFLTISVYAVCRLAGQLPGIGGRFLDLLVTVALYKYASQVLISTANGRMEAPENLSTVQDGAGWQQVWLQFILIVVAFGLAWLIAPTSLLLATLVVLFIAFATPGATMSVAIDGDISQALNPATWLQVMARIGWPYFVVALLCFAFLVSRVKAQDLIVPFLPGWLGVIVFYLILHYTVVATFHLMGYLVYQYHEQLGYEVQERVKLRRPGEVDNAVLEDAEALIREGETQRAEEMLREEVSRGAPAAVHERYRKLAAMRGDNALLVQHGREWLNALVAQENDRRALELVRECRALEPGFLPADPGIVTRLAHKAADLGMSQLALELTSGYHRNHPRHPDVAKNYLLAARLLAEKFNREAQARQLLLQLQQQYPKHPLMPEIETYLHFLDGLQGKARASGGTGPS